MAKIMLSVGPLAVTGGTTTFFTVPVGERYVVRHIHAQNTFGGANNISFGGSPLGTFLGAQPMTTTGTPGVDLDFWMRKAFEAGTTLTAQASASSVNVTVDYDRVILGE